MSKSQFALNTNLLQILVINIGMKIISVFKEIPQIAIAITEIIFHQIKNIREGDWYLQNLSQFNNGQKLELLMNQVFSGKRW